MFCLSDATVGVNQFEGYITDHTSILSNDIINNAHDCLKSCQKQRKLCVGATYSHISNICQLHTDRFLMCNADVRWEKGYTHYQILPCLTFIFHHKRKQQHLTTFPQPKGNDGKFSFTIASAFAKRKEYLHKIEAH